jgi:hypothetical protein
VRWASSCGQVLAAVRQSFGFLLEQAELLKVVRAEAHQMALASHGDLQRLANPPCRIGGEPGTVRDVKTIDRLHQPADGFLQQIAIGEAVVPEPLCNVRGEPDIRAG